MIKKYQKYILNINPTANWVKVRSVLHWVSLPLKLILIGGLGCFQILLHKLKNQKRPNPEIKDLETRKKFFNKIYKNLPILETENTKLYTNRVPYNSVPMEHNYNTDHQCLRQGTYAFVMSKINKRDYKIDNALIMHAQNQYLARGYKLNPYEDITDYNISTTSGDMLCGLTLGMLGVTNEFIKDRFENLVINIIENDYSVLEGAAPQLGDYEREVWDEQIKTVLYPEHVKMKSSRGMWQPGLETVGAQALTILAAIRYTDKKLKSPTAAKEYRKLLYNFGYGLLSLFPTAYINSKRGYFNDHNCLTALYVLSKLSDNKWGKLFWKFPMMYVWNLSKHWYNPYFTGLVMDCYPELVSEEYRQLCENYLYESEPRDYGYLGGGEVREITDIPSGYNRTAEEEFYPENRQNEAFVMAIEADKIKLGLGFIASAIMIEKDPIKLLDE